jgi:hypothetical protein
LCLKIQKLFELPKLAFSLLKKNDEKADNQSKNIIFAFYCETKPSGETKYLKK